MSRKAKVTGYKEEDLLLIKAVEVDVVLEKLGIDVIRWRRSAGYICLCPFHPDNNPSFAIQNDGDNKGRWNCFHDPDSKGDIFEFIARIKGINRGEAKELLIQWFNLDRALVPDLADLRARLQPEEPEEWAVPRIPMPRTIADRTPIIEYLLTDKSRKKSNYSEEEANSIIDRWSLRFAEAGYYKDRIIIPIWNQHGGQVYFQAQSINKDMIKHLPDPLNKAKLWPAKAPVKYHLHNIHRIQTDYTIIVEGFWDAVALDHWGLPVIVAGQSKLSQEQIVTILQRFHRIWLWFDNDASNPNNPGLKSAHAIARQLCLQAIDCWVVEGPPGDPDEVGGGEMARSILREQSVHYQRRRGPTVEQLKKRLVP